MDSGKISLSYSLIGCVTEKRDVGEAIREFIMVVGVIERPVIQARYPCQVICEPSSSALVMREKSQHLCIHWRVQALSNRQIIPVSPEQA
jgi:hypothetical protein